MSLSRRQRTWLAILAGAFVLFSVTGFFVLPPIVKAQLERRLSATLGRTVTVGRVRINPYRLSLTLEDFDIQEAGGHQSFLGWRRLAVTADALASVTGDWTLSRIELDGFHARFAINADHSFNVSDLLAKFAGPVAPAAGPAKPAPALRVGSLRVTAAQVDFSDRSRPHPFASVLGPLTFDLTAFRTVGARGAPYHFEAVTEAGEKLDWTGTLAADPVASTGDFAIENLVLKKYAPYFEEAVLADVTAGTLSLHGHYEANLDPAHHVLKLSQGNVRLRDLTVLERATGKPALTLPSLEVQGIDADALTLKASMQSVALAGGQVHVRRNADGSLNLLKLLPPPPVAAAPPAPASPPDFLIGEVSLKDFAIDVTDLAAPQPVQLGLNQLQVSVRQVTLAPGSVLPVQVAFAWAPQGTVSVEGTVSLLPTLAAHLHANVTGFALLPLSPYLEQFVNARLTQGTVSATTSTTFTMANGTPALTLAGDLQVDHFGLVDSGHNRDLAGFQSFRLAGLKLASAPRPSVAIAEVDLVQPYADVRVEADQSINVAALAKAGPPAPPGPASRPDSAGPSSQVEIGRVVVTAAKFDFTDRSIEPNVHLSVDQFGGTVAGLSSANLAKADVDLQGTVNGSGAVTVAGKLDPLGPVKFVDVKLGVKNVDLTPLSPYAGKFAGYDLARGQLGVTAAFHLQGDAIDATNVVVLNQFTFGNATNSPTATGLPVRLGVALLKDLDGKIIIDLPIQGELGDPNFRIGKVVLRVVVNLLTKAAVSPFSLIGSMFGGGGPELAYQEFSPGRSDLQASELPKLEVVTKALTNRPALSLGIQGAYDTRADAYALQQLKLADLVRRRVWAARHAADPTTPPPAELVIAPADYAAMVKLLFDEKFPPGTTFGTPLPAPPPVAAPPAGPPPSWWGRVVNLVTFKARRERRAAQAENQRRAAAYAQTVAAARAAGLPLDEMTGRLAAAITVTDDDLRALANARAERVREQLVTAGHIEAARLFLAPSPAASTQNQGPRVFLTLE